MFVAGSVGPGEQSVAGGVFQTMTQVSFCVLCLVVDLNQRVAISGSSARLSESRRPRSCSTMCSRALSALARIHSSHTRPRCGRVLRLAGWVSGSAETHPTQITRIQRRFLRLSHSGAWASQGGMSRAWRRIRTVPPHPTHEARTRRTRAHGCKWSIKPSKFSRSASVCICMLNLSSILLSKPASR